MGKPFLFCLLGLLCTGTVSGKHLDLVEEPPEPALEGTLMPHPFAAQRLGFEALGGFGARTAFGTDFAPELVQAGFDCPGFAEKGDLLWEWRACENMMIAGNPFRIGVVTTAWIHPATARVWGWWGVGGPAREIEHRFGVHNPWKRVETPILLPDRETGETNVPATEITYIERNGDSVGRRWTEANGEGQSDGEEREPQERFWTRKGTIIEQHSPVAWEDVGAGTQDEVVGKARRLAALRGIDAEGTAECQSTLYPIACGIPAFCTRGEWVLDLRFVRPAEGNAPPGCRMVLAELLLHPATGKTCCVVGPPDLLGIWPDE